MKLGTDRDEWLEKASKNDSWAKKLGGGVVVWRECPICGWLTWSTTGPNVGEATGITFRVEEMENITECLVCQEVAKRSPEVYRMIVGVVMKAVGRV